MANESPSLWSDVHLREKRRRRALVFAICSAAIFLIFVAATWTVFYSPLFLIKKIEVLGNKSVASEDVINLAEAALFKSSFVNRALGAMNIVVWPKSLPEEDFKLLPELKSLSIDKNYGSKKIEITVEERKQFGVWCFYRAENGADNLPAGVSGEIAPDCFWFDAGGVIFRKTANMEGSIITVVDDYSQKNVGLGSKILPEEFISNIFSIFRAVSAGGIRVKEMRLNDLSLEELELDIYGGLSTEVSTKAGPKIYFSLRFPLAGFPEVIDSLQAKPEFKNMQYIDFRVENRVYYK